MYLDNLKGLVYRHPCSHGQMIHWEVSFRLQTLFIRTNLYAARKTEDDPLLESSNPSLFLCSIPWEADHSIPLGFLAIWILEGFDQRHHQLKEMRAETIRILILSTLSCLAAPVPWIQSCSVLVKSPPTLTACDLRPRGYCFWWVLGPGCFIISF